MKCKCIQCEHEYENERDYQTSICNECFKWFNESRLQPLKDGLHRVVRKNIELSLEVERLRKGVGKANIKED